MNRTIARSRQRRRIAAGVLTMTAFVAVFVTPFVFILLQAEATRTSWKMWN